MRFLSSQAPWWLFALVNQACGLGLLEALAEYPELSILTTKVKANPVLTSLLGDADGFTFFAPSNTAIETFQEAQLNLTTDATFQAIIQYSLIKGGFPRVSFTNESQFLPSNLVDAKYSNVTGGQVVELIENDGRPQVISGNQSISTLTTSDIVAAGGIIHIVDNVLTLPVPTVNAITAAKLGYFVSILTRGGYLSRTKNQYVHEVLDSTDVTYFIPNTQEALIKFNGLAAIWSDEDLKKNFQYHVVPRYLGYSSNLRNGTSLKTVDGTNLTITTDGEDMYVNAAKIISTDVLVSNGVIHVIDGLLDRFNTAVHVAVPPSSNRISEEILTSSTITSTPTPSPTPTPSQAEIQTSSSPTPTTTPNPLAQNSNKDLTLKVAVGASLSGATVILLVALFLFLRHRKANKIPTTEKGAWDGHSLSTSPSNPKRYFVNNGSVQMRDRESIPPTGMVPVTNLEHERDAATRYHYQGKARPGVPLRSPSRMNSRPMIRNDEQSYF